MFLRNYGKFLQDLHGVMMYKRKVFGQHRGKLKLQKLGMSDVTLLVLSLSFDELPRRLIEKI